MQMWEFFHPEDWDNAEQDRNSNLNRLPIVELLNNLLVLEKTPVANFVVREKFVFQSELPLMVRLQTRVATPRRWRMDRSPLCLIFLFIADGHLSCCSCHLFFNEIFLVVSCDWFANFAFVLSTFRADTCCGRRVDERCCSTINVLLYKRSTDAELTEKIAMNLNSICTHWT